VLTRAKEQTRTGNEQAAWRVIKVTKARLRYGKVRIAFETRQASFHRILMSVKRVNGKALIEEVVGISTGTASCINGDFVVERKQIGGTFYVWSVRLARNLLVVFVPCY
jgi:hypothetical protein